MANEKDRTGNEPTPMSEDEAKTVVGGEDFGADGPGPDTDPCLQLGCNCEYSNSAQCTCENHPHL